MIPFKEKDVKNYLDINIANWRKKKNEADISNFTRDLSICYIDAFQTVRIALFGEMLK